MLDSLFRDLGTLGARFRQLVKDAPALLSEESKIDSFRQPWPDHASLLNAAQRHSLPADLDSFKSRAL